MTQNHTDAEFLARAQEAYQVDGEVEFDDDAQVSQNDKGQGAYVQAWVWVEFPEEEARCESTRNQRTRCVLPLNHKGDMHFAQEKLGNQWANGPYTVGLVDGTGESNQFATEVEAATYISTLPNHDDGRYYLDGPAGIVD